MIQMAIAAFVDFQLAPITVFAHRSCGAGSLQGIEGYLIGTG